MKHLNDVMDVGLYLSYKRKNKGLLSNFKLESSQPATIDKVRIYALNESMKFDYKQLAAMCLAVLDGKPNAELFKRALSTLCETDSVILEVYCFLFSDDDELTDALRAVLINYKRSTIIEEMLNIIALQQFVINKEDEELLKSCIKFRVQNIANLIKENPDLLLEYKQDLFEFSKFEYVSKTDFFMKFTALCNRPVKRNSNIANYFRLLNVTPDKILLCNLLHTEFIVSNSKQATKIYYNYFCQKMESPNKWSDVAKENLTKHLSCIHNEIVNGKSKLVRIANRSNYEWFLNNSGCFDALFFSVNLNDSNSITLLNILDKKQLLEVLKISFKYQGANSACRQIFETYEKLIYDLYCILDDKEFKAIWEKAFEYKIILKCSPSYSKWLLTLPFIKIKKLLKEADNLVYFIDLLNEPEFPWDKKLFIQELWSQANAAEKADLLEHVSDDQDLEGLTQLRLFCESDMTLEFFEEGIDYQEKFEEYKIFPSNLQYKLWKYEFPLNYNKSVYWALSSIVKTKNIFELYNKDTIIKTIDSLLDQGISDVSQVLLPALQYGVDFAPNFNHFFSEIGGTIKELEENKEIVFSDEIFLFKYVHELQVENVRLLLNFDFKITNKEALNALKEKLVLDMYINLLKYFEWCGSDRDIELILAQPAEFFNWVENAKEDLVNYVDEDAISLLTFIKLHCNDQVFTIVKEAILETDCVNGLLNDYEFLSNNLNFEQLDCNDFIQLSKVYNELYDNKCIYDKSTIKYLGTSVFTVLQKICEGLDSEILQQMCFHVKSKSQLKSVLYNLEEIPLEWFLQKTRGWEMLMHEYPWEIDYEDSNMLADYILDHYIYSKEDLLHSLFTGTVNDFCESLELNNEERIVNYRKILRIKNPCVLYGTYSYGRTEKLLQLVKSYVLEKHSEILKSICSDRFLKDAAKWIELKIDSIEILNAHQITLETFEPFMIDNVKCVFIDDEIALLGKDEESLQEFRNLGYKMYVYDEKDIERSVLIPQYFSKSVSIENKSYYFPTCEMIPLRQVIMED